MGFGVQPSGRVDRTTPHHPDLRQHPPHGRTCDAASRRTAGQGRGGRAPRQSVEGKASRRRATPESRHPACAGRHGLAGARHRYRGSRAGLPACVAAFHRSLPPARRSSGPCGGRHLQGAAVSDFARRPGRMRGVAGCGAPRRTRHAAHAARTAGRAGATDRGGSRLRRTRRGGTVRDVPTRVSVSQAHARDVHRGTADAGRRLQHQARHPRCVPAPRCGQRQAARTARRAPDRNHFRRRDPRYRRLRRGAGTAIVAHR